MGGVVRVGAAVPAVIATQGLIGGDLLGRQHGGGLEVGEQMDGSKPTSQVGDLRGQIAQGGLVDVAMQEPSRQDGFALQDLLPLLDRRPRHAIVDRFDLSKLPRPQIECAAAGRLENVQRAGIAVDLRRQGLRHALAGLERGDLCGEQTGQRNAELALHQRLAAYLVDQVGASDAGRGPVEIRLAETHQEIGSRIGTVRELVSRLLGDFRRQGLIRMKGRRVTIPDLDRLRAMKRERACCS